jgi:hypothetical protein
MEHIIPKKIFQLAKVVEQSRRRRTFQLAKVREQSRRRRMFQLAKVMEYSVSRFPINRIIV